MSLEALQVRESEPLPSTEIGEAGSTHRAPATDALRARVNRAGDSTFHRAPLVTSAPIAKPRKGDIKLFQGTFFRKGALSLVDQGIVSATNFSTLVLVGRASQHELGVYLLGFSVVLLAMCAQNALISSPYALFGNRLEGLKRAQYAGSTLLHLIVYAAMASVLLAVIGWTLPLIYQHAPSEAVARRLVEFLPFSSVALVLACAMPFVLLREFIRRLAFAHLELVTVLGLDIAVSALQLVGVFVLYLGGQLTAATAFICVGASCAIAGGTTFYIARRHFAHHNGQALADLRGNWSFGKWAFAGQTATLLSAYCLPWMLTLLAGVTEAGRFSACFSIVLIANPLLIGLNNFLTPQAIHAYKAEGLKALRKLAWGISFWVTGVLALLTVGLVLFGGRLLSLLYGQKLMGNELPVSILAVMMFFLAAGIGSENGLVALNRPAANFWAYLSGLIVTLTTGAILIATHGVVGAALAGLLGTISSTSVKIILFARACRQMPERSAV